MPKFCRDCVHSKTEVTSDWVLRCYNDRVATTDFWNLSSAKNEGTPCREERAKSWILFPACGMSGKLYDKKL